MMHVVTHKLVQLTAEWHQRQ